MKILCYLKVTLLLHPMISKSPWRRGARGASKGSQGPLRWALWATRCRARRHDAQQSLVTSGAAGRSASAGAAPPRRKVFNSTNQNSPFGRLWRPLAIGYESAGAPRDPGTLYGPPSEPPCRIRKFGDVRKVVRSVGLRPLPLLPTSDEVNGGS